MATHKGLPTLFDGMGATRHYIPMILQNAGSNV